MRFESVFKNLRLTVIALGVGVGLAASLAVMVGGCADGGQMVGGPAASLDTRVGAQPQLPPLDLEAPRDFQTASFAFG
jgi:hypothetical protein